MNLQNQFYHHFLKINLSLEPNDFFNNYQEHKNKQLSWRLIFVLLAVSCSMTIFAIICLISRIQLDIDSNDKLGWLFALLLFNVFEIIIMIPVFIILYSYHNLNTTSSSTTTTMIKVNALVQDIWLNQLCLRMGMSLCLTVWIGNCDGDKNKYFCNNQANSNGIPLTFGLTLYLFPIVIPVLLSCIRFYAVASAWMIVVISYLISFSLIGWTQELIIAFIIIAIPVIIVLLEFERQHLKLYKSGTTLEENQRQAKEAHATEMRYMISNVAHDLKTPLASFYGGIEVMQHIILDSIQNYKNGHSSYEKMIESFNSLLEYIQGMVHTNTFMIMTVNRCIDYTKASNGVHLVPKLESICLRDAIMSPIKLIDYQQSRIHIEMVDISDEISKNIMTDNQWLQENILCLLSNAVKYSVGGSVQVSTSLVHFDAIDKTKFEIIQQEKCSDSQITDVEIGGNISVTLGQILFEIEDTGNGLSDEAKSKLFQPFNQDIHQRGGNSTGLGLFSLARRIDALNGKYGVFDRKDNQNGCRFWFTIPYQPAPTIIEQVEISNKLSSEPQKSPLVPVSQQLKLKVLVVDDSMSILKVTTLMLTRLGCIVDNACNGQESLEMTIKQFECNTPYDVVLTDIQMPIMNGFEYAKELRSIEFIFNTSQNNNHSIRHQLVIGVSADSNDHTASTADEVGIDAFLTKPFSIKAFLDLVGDLSCK